MILRSFLRSRWALALKTLPFVALIVLVKFLVHGQQAEFLTLNSLFGAIISANIFLIGFLISGVLVDYKESEKLPSELSSHLEALTDEVSIVWQNKRDPVARAFLRELAEFSTLTVSWFYKKTRTDAMMKRLTGFNHFFLAFEPLTQANFIVRMKQDQAAIRRLLKRADTIRDTSFLGTGYAVAEIITCILAIGMIFVRMDPFYESVFFVSFVSFITIYMIMFIRFLDNPFEYRQTDHLVEEVSLKPLLDTQKRISAAINEK
ncbi:MAG: hypothetical protein WCV84_05440 [Patescibacteria group bacterium]